MFAIVGIVSIVASSRIIITGTVNKVFSTSLSRRDQLLSSVQVLR